MERLTAPTRTGGGGPWLVATWVAGLIVVVALALSGPRTEPPPPRTAAPPSPSPSDSASLAAADGVTPIRLVRPAAMFEQVTTARVVVSGIAEPRVRQVFVLLEAGRGRIIARAVVPTTWLPRFQSDAIGRQFTVSLPLPTPRPNGTLWVRVGPAGWGPGAAVGVPIDVGPLGTELAGSEVAANGFAATADGPRGEDGLMGRLPLH